MNKLFSVFVQYISVEISPK